MEKPRIKKVTFWQGDSCYVYDSPIATDALYEYEKAYWNGYPLLQIFHENGEDRILVNSITSIDIEYAENLPTETEELFDQLKEELK